MSGPVTLEEIIAAHEYIGSYYQCACTLDINEGTGNMDRDEWASHVAVEVRKVFGVVELPEPHLWDTGVQDDALNFEIGLQRHLGAIYLRGIYFRVATYRNDWQDDDNFCCEDSITPTEARNLAAALLAAANAAEVES